MRAHDILKQPVITEKAISDAGGNVYVFNVDLRANKHQIQDAIEKVFNVEVGSVKTLIRKGKVRRVGKRFKTKKMPDVKKAYITLKKGTIDIVPKA